MSSNSGMAATALSDAYALGVATLKAANKDQAELDAGILLEHATRHGALTRLTAPETAIDHRHFENFMRMIERRAKGEPTHRITGTREFYGLHLALNEATLVPRPDTEILVDTAIPLMRETIKQTGQCRILDLGTGTGAIALALLNEAPQATAIGIDVSPRALAAARANAESLDLGERFSALQSDWFSGVTGTFDLIVSNPPYIAHNEIPQLDVEVREHDPVLALDGGVDGLDAYGIIAARVLPFLTPEGRVIVEIGPTQKAQVTAFFEAAGLTRTAEAPDLAGRDRVLCFCRSTG